MSWTKGYADLLLDKVVVNDWDCDFSGNFCGDEPKITALVFASIQETV